MSVFFCFFGVVSFLAFSYDIERQQLIEIPSQAEAIPFKFLNENRNLQPPHESVHPTELSRRYLPTARTPEQSSLDLYATKNEVRRKQTSEGRPRNAYLPTEKTFEEDSPKSDSTQTDSILDANDVRNSDQTDE